MFVPSYTLYIDLWSAVLQFFCARGDTLRDGVNVGFKIDVKFKKSRFATSTYSDISEKQKADRIFNRKS